MTTQKRVPQARGSRARTAILNRSRAGISAPISQRTVFSSLSAYRKDFSAWPPFTLSDIIYAANDDTKDIDECKAGVVRKIWIQQFQACGSN